MMKSLQHEQTQMPSGCAFVCSNQCPWCFRILKNTHAVEAHVAMALKDCRCQKAQLKDINLSMNGKRIRANDMFFCEFCEIDFDNLLKYNKHVQLHASPGSGFFFAMNFANLRSADTETRCCRSSDRSATHRKDF